MTMRPKENPYNQSEIGYQSVNTTINNMSSISGYFTLTPLFLIFLFRDGSSFFTLWLHLQTLFDAAKILFPKLPKVWARFAINSVKVPYLAMCYFSCLLF